MHNIMIIFWPYEPATPIYSEASNGLSGELSLSGQCDSCLCSHELFIALGQHQEAGYSLFSSQVACIAKVTFFLVPMTGIQIILE